MTARYALLGIQVYRWVIEPWPHPRMDMAPTDIQFHGLIYLISLAGVVVLVEWSERYWKLPPETWFRVAESPKALDPANQAKVEQVISELMKDRAKERELDQDALDLAKEEWQRRSAE